MSVTVTDSHDPKQVKFDNCKEFSWNEWERTINWEFKRVKKLEEATLGVNFFERDTLKGLHIMKSKQIYKILDRMPKGVLHHNHMDCLDDLEFFKKHVINFPGVYLNDTLTSWHFGTPEEAEKNRWITTAHARNRYDSDEEFEAAVLNVTQFLPSLAAEFSYSEKVWTHFERRIMAFLPLFHQKELYRLYLIHIADVYVKNGYYRLELKVSLKQKEHPDFEDIRDFVRRTQQIENEIKQKHPSFSLGLIPFGFRNFTDQELQDYMRIVYRLESHLIVGIDMVNEEDNAPGFERYAAIIQKVQEEFKDAKGHIQGVFSAGETRNINNHNIAKVVQFGSKRIGHALNLFQHSYLIPVIAEKNICIETCPLSSQYLGYVYNLLQHPAIAYYNLGLPISISSDDPARFGYSGVTPDFFVTAHAFGFDLKDFKLLGIYSILHALCSNERKAKLLDLFEKDWKIFMESVKAEFGI